MTASLKQRLLHGDDTTANTGANRAFWCQQHQIGSVAIATTVVITCLAVLCWNTTPPALPVEFAPKMIVDHDDDAKTLTAMLDKTDAMAAAKNFLDAWASGKMNDAATAAPFITKDFVLDPTGPDLPGFRKKAYGAAGLASWAIKYSQLFEPTGIQASFSPGPTPDSVFWTHNITGIAKASGKEVVISAIDLYKVVNGRVASLKIYYSDAKALTVMLEKDNAEATVKNFLAAWGAGKLSDAASAAPYVTEDFILDPTGPDLPGFRQKAEGAAGLAAWATKYGQLFEPKSVQGSYSPGPTRDSVYWAYSIGGIATASGKEVVFSGVDLYKVVDGQVASLKIYYDDAKALTAMLAQ